MENIEEQKLEAELLDIIVNEYKIKKSLLNLFKRKDRHGISKINYTKLYKYVYKKIQDKIERHFECIRLETYEEGYSEVADDKHYKIINKYEDMWNKIVKIATSLHLTFKL